MLRNAFLAVAVSAGLFGVTEMGSNTAQADTHFRIGFVGGHRRIYFPPIVIGGPVIVSRPVIYAPPPPVVVTPAPVVVSAPPVVVYSAPAPAYTVLYRSAPSAPWQTYASYPTYQGAQAAVPNLLATGMWVMIEQN